MTDIVENHCVWPLCGNSGVVAFKKGLAVRLGALLAVDTYTDLSTIWIYSKTGYWAWAGISMVLWLNGALVATMSAYQRYLRERPEDHEDGWADRIVPCVRGFLNLEPLYCAWQAMHHTDAQITSRGGDESLRMIEHLAFMEVEAPTEPRPNPSPEPRPQTPGLARRRGPALVAGVWHLVHGAGSDGHGK